jgi:hypothetical protein
MSVAVCDTPNGKFEFLGHVKHPDGRLLTDYVIFDPGLLNDDGVIRLYYGMWHNFEENDALTYEENIENQIRTFKKSREEIENTPGGVMGPIMVELCDDMLTIKSDPVRIFPRDFRGTCFEGHEFFEASSMRKIGEKYYFVYSTFNGHELAYATSDYPNKDFTFGGVIVSNGDIGYKGRKTKDQIMRVGNNHGSIIEINGQWYIFYHRHTAKTELSRQGCAEKIEILPNGKIEQVEITSCGLNGAPLIASGSYPAIICCALTNGKLHYGECKGERLPHIICKNDERFLCEIEDGSLFGYKYFNFDKVSSIGVKYRSGDKIPSGVLEIMTEENGKALAEIEISDAKGWTNASANVSIKGTNALYFKYFGDGAIDVIEIFFE